MRHTVEQSVHAGSLHAQYLQTGIIVPVLFYHYGHPKSDQQKYTRAETRNFSVLLVALL